MKAIVQEKYGNPDVLHYKEVEKPKPKENEILIKIYSTSVTAAHCAMRKGKPFIGRLVIGLTKPKFSTPGTDLAGEIVEVGKDVTKFKVGDQIIAATDAGGGCYAEYISLSEDDVILAKPKNMNFDDAAAIIEGATTALSFLRDSAKIKIGKKILINGASGSIGTSAVQLAKYFGAEVTAVYSTNNIDLVRSIGADFTIDYSKENFNDDNKKYDIIFDTVGKLTFKESKNSLTENGIFLSPVLSFSILLQMLISSKFSKRKVIFSATGLRKPNQKIRDLIFLKELIENNKLVTVLEKKYKLEEVVKAHEYVEKGHKRGNVVLSITAS